MARIRTLKPDFFRSRSLANVHRRSHRVARQQHGTTVSPVAWDQVRGR